MAQPPLRGDVDREALWRGIADGTIDTLGSDHAPWTRALKLDPKLDVAHPRPGVAELDTMLPLFFTEAVAKERISLERFVALTATNAVADERILGNSFRLAAVMIPNVPSAPRKRDLMS